MALTISELARGAGVGVETVRYYQRRKLLSVPETASGWRRYDAEDLSRLRFIRTAQRAGFSLEEIGELLVLDAATERGRVRELARERIAMLDAKIADMQAARQALEGLVTICAKGVGDKCPIISAFDQGQVPYSA